MSPDSPCATTSHTVLEAKTGISRARLPEPFLVSLYRGLAPYRGCEHACAYCDGRAEIYFVEGQFDRDISVRMNLAERVAADVSSHALAREYGSICIGSGVTDVYQPLERELGIMRTVLGHLSETGLPLVILTKSDAILRDFDILSRFPRVLVIVTVTTVNAGDARYLEPGASSAAERLAVVRLAKERGFSSGVMAMPLCPGISDVDESFGALLDAASAAGADFVYPGGLTLRPGSQKDAFLSVIDARYPSLRPLYDRLYRENRQSGMPVSDAGRTFVKNLDRRVRERGLPQMIPHRVYRDLLCPPDAFFVLLCHMQSLYSLRGIDTRPLKAATDRFADSLAAERTALRRKRTIVADSDPFPITRILTERFMQRMAVSSGADSLAGLLENDRLAMLAASLQEKGAYFDYPSLRVMTDKL